MSKIELTHEKIHESKEIINLGVSTNKKDFIFIINIDLNSDYNLMNEKSKEKYRLSVVSYYNLLCGDKMYYTTSQKDFTIYPQMGYKLDVFYPHSLPQPVLLDAIYKGIELTTDALSHYYHNTDTICPGQVGAFLDELKYKNKIPKGAQIFHSNLKPLPESCLLSEDYKGNKVNQKDIYSQQF